MYPDTAFSIYSNILYFIFFFPHSHLFVTFVIRKAIELYTLTYPIALATRNIVSSVIEAKAIIKILDDSPNERNRSP